MKLQSLYCLSVRVEICAKFDGVSATSSVVAVVARSGPRSSRSFSATAAAARGRTPRAYAARTQLSSRVIKQASRRCKKIYYSNQFFVSLGLMVLWYLMLIYKKLFKTVSRYFIFAKTKVEDLKSERFLIKYCEVV